MAIRGFSKGKKVSESENANAIVNADTKKKQQEKEAQSTANLSPLARFLLSRLVKSQLLAFLILPAFAPS